MAETLPFIGVDRMEDVDNHLHFGTDRYQVFVSELTPLSHAVELLERMRPGAPGVAFRVFNPEVLVHKVHGEREIQAALARITDCINSAIVYFAANQVCIGIVQAKIALGPYAVHVGPPINRRGLAYDQVIYPSNEQVPEFTPPPPRRTLSGNQKRQYRSHDAASQMELWKLNLAALESRQAALGQLINSLVASKESFGQNALRERTRLASGFTDFTFYY